MKENGTMFRFLFKILCVFILVLGITSSAFAQEDTYFPQARSYQYDLIKTIIHINSDTTFDVEEHQTFDFHGGYHQAERVIPFNKIDGISDIVVVDGSSNVPLSFSSSTLDKTNSASWNKYTTFSSNNEQHIVWYYDVLDAKHEWIIKYKIHGGITFEKENDRLYWNIFTNYSVPIKSSSVEVYLPNGARVNEKLTQVYRSTNAPVVIKSTTSSSIPVAFTGQDFQPFEDFTIDVFFPKGYIDRSLYWRDFIKMYYGYVGAVALVILMALIIFARYLATERFVTGRGTIVPQYDPPKKLKPAVAEVIIKEKLTPKGFAATLIDLAVRGYLSIEEEKKGIFGNFAGSGCALGIIVLVFVIIFSSFTLVAFADKNASFLPIIPIFFVVFVFVLVMFIRVMTGFGVSFSIKDYILYRKNPKKQSDLEEYEKKYLDILFDGSDVFSTSELRYATSRKQKMYREMMDLQEDIFKETNIKTKAYDVSPLDEKKGSIIYFALIMIGVFAISFVGGFVFDHQSIILLLAIGFCSAIVYTFFHYEARLNYEGRVLKEEWLGFKLYLEVAEKYTYERKLTPELFEKYLPYTMILGVEKKWAHAFDALLVEPPQWYGGVNSFSSSNSFSSTFSASGFSASFSSSFTSAFASSGASGSSGGGGGSAGGGGGGGGGGAS